MQVNDGFQEGNLFFKLFDAALRRERFEKLLLALDQEVELFHDATLDDDAGIRGGLLEHVVFGLVDHGLDFLNIFFVEHGEASLCLMEPV